MQIERERSWSGNPWNSPVVVENPQTETVRPSPGDLTPASLAAGTSRRISIFGLGYVGAVSAACLASMGHSVVGLDVSAAKRDALREGRAPVVEPRLDDLMQRGVHAGCLTASDDVEAAVQDTDVSIVCVGTPSRGNGSVDTDMVGAVAAELGRALRSKRGDHLVIVRSTMVPGTMRRVVVPILERESGRRDGEGLFVAYNPEFMRESTAVGDFFAPPKTVIGADGVEAARQVAALYDGLPGPFFSVPFEISEMIKYADNTWHALKVCFGNEIGNLCQAVGIDSHALMDVFLADVKLNISPAYLKPGFAFGGSCLPKDARALTHLAKQLDVETPILCSILPSNRAQVERAVQRVVSFGRRNVAVLGFSFKAGTDDLRESPQVELIERLIGKGYRLRLYDGSVSLSALIGRNREHIERTIPHIASILSDTWEEAIEQADVVIIGNGSDEFRRIGPLLRDDQIVLDLVRIGDRQSMGAGYVGINW